jgi:NTP pyrophosphatase (non-canonical NTP hydrolase)
VNASEYAAKACRTECDQDAARKRYTGVHGTAAPTLTPVRLNHAVLGLAGEVGELAGAVEKWLHYGRDLDVANVGEEVGDCCWYLALACNALGLDFGEVLAANLRKLAVRYPEKYTDEHARCRDLDGERRAMASPSPRGVKYPHVFDSSRTCDYCGISAERAQERNECPTRKAQAKREATDLAEREEYASGGGRLAAPPQKPVFQDGHGFGHADEGEKPERSE